MFGGEVEALGLDDFAPVGAQLEEYEEGLGQAVAEFVGVPDLVAPAAAFGSPEYMAELAAREAQQAVDMGLEGVEMTMMRVPLGALNVAEELAEETAAIAVEGGLGLMVGLSGAAAVAGAFAPGILSAFGIYLVNLANKHEAQFKYDLERRTLSDSGDYMGNLAYILVGRMYMPCYVNGDFPQTFDIKYKDITGFPREVTIEILEAMTTNAFFFLSPFRKWLPDDAKTAYLPFYVAKRVWSGSRTTRRSRWIRL